MGFVERFERRLRSRTTSVLLPSVFAPANWGSDSRDVRAVTTEQFLQFVAAASHLEARVMFVEEGDEDDRFEIRGTLHEFPLRVSMWSSATAVSIDVRFRETNETWDRCSLRIVYDPKSHWDPPSPSTLTLPIAPHLSVWSYAGDRQPAPTDFEWLSASLRGYVARELPRLGIRDIYWWPKQVEVSCAGPRESRDPVHALVDTIALALECVTARGDVPPAAHLRGFADRAIYHWGCRIAERIAGFAPGAEVHENDDEKYVDVKWIEQGVGVSIGFHCRDRSERDDRVSIMALVPTPANFSIFANTNIDNDGYCRVHLTPRLFVQAAESQAKAGAAWLRALPSALLADMQQVFDEALIGCIEVRNDMLCVEPSRVSQISDDGAAAVRLARLLARVAAALPRTPRAGVRRA